MLCKNYDKPSRCPRVQLEHRLLWLLCYKYLKNTLCTQFHPVVVRQSTPYALLSWVEEYPCVGLSLKLLANTLHSCFYNFVIRVHYLLIMQLYKCKESFHFTCLPVSINTTTGKSKYPQMLYLIAGVVYFS